MVKRLSLEQFEQIVSRLQLNTQTVEIAKRVLVEGDPQSALVTATGLTKGAISQAVNRVWSEFENREKGAERLTVVLPEHQAYIVKQWAAKFAARTGAKK